MPEDEFMMTMEFYTHLMTLPESLINEYWVFTQSALQNSGLLDTSQALDEVLKKHGKLVYELHRFIPKAPSTHTELVSMEMSKSYNPSLTELLACKVLI